MFSCNAPEDRAEKDSVANVRATGEFVTNLVTWELRDAMNNTSFNAPHGTDEFELAGLAKAPSIKVKPPRVAASPASMECKLYKIMEIEPIGPGDTASHVVFGHVVALHLDDSLLDSSGRFDVVRSRPLTRLGGSQYAAPGELVELGRPNPPRV